VTSKNFEKTLQAYQKRKPFRSYRVRFVDGEYIDVDHPEALVLRGTAAVFLPPTIRRPFSITTE
jgi:hypothetical protein